ncbi:ROK family protein [Actinosynnema sp. NPDC047251]|uniref:Transcriptional regulator, ROK family n=1 Tax=Saccharothrix espanaensis (strain ATCC 51144 / DSM 44229 / JCM 9112 / NBRC 15066 / NRRL 15764) TaxID=1179773 RepID=K0K5T3_SACES|nr:ROK family protein [Saccharothrix espanaensis]CCH35610.1 Transcriptional regulator, ROK family [Saccharothrix espanaensis DSM 44229]
MTDLVLALDVGGTKIAGGLVDRAGAVRRAVRVATPTDDAEQTWRAVADVVEQVLDGELVAGVGIACAGPVDAALGTASPINVTAWQAFPLRDRVAELVPGVPVELAGDGPCMALGEHWQGAGRDSRFLLGLVVSTGVGGGLVLGGRPFGGRTGNAGHVGHVVVEPDGEPCTCGGRGCAETVAGGPRMVAWARRQGWQGPDEADAAHLAAAAMAGHELPRAAFERAGRAVGLAIAATAAVCDLDLAVVGGGVAQAGDLLFDPIRRTVADHCGLSYLDGLRVEPARLGGQAGLVGAAALVLRP